MSENKKDNNEELINKIIEKLRGISETSALVLIYEIVVRL